MTIDISLLNDYKLQLCKKTISSNAFYYIVGDKLKRKESLSVVRVADGERILLDATKTKNPRELVDTFNDTWLERYGLSGISYGELKQRILRAGNECNYLAPSISGIQNEIYNLYDYFNPREEYVDNFFVNLWTNEMKQKLYDIAGDILLIHGNIKLADIFQKRLPYSRLDYIKLNNWSQTEDVIKESSSSKASMVIFSGGAAGKYIGPQISKSGKVVIDVGNTMEAWVPK